LARLKDEQGTPFAPAIGATRPSPNKYVRSLPGMAPWHEQAIPAEESSVARSPVAGGYHVQALHDALRAEGFVIHAGIAQDIDRLLGFFARLRR
jgi:hypothetical protein